MTEYQFRVISKIRDPTQLLKDWKTTTKHSLLLPKTQIQPKGFTRVEREKITERSKLPQFLTIGIICHLSFLNQETEWEAKVSVLRWLKTSRTGRGRIIRPTTTEEEKAAVENGREEGRTRISQSRKEEPCMLREGSRSLRRGLR